MSAIQIANLTRCFGKFTAVDNLTFSVPYGVCFGLLGRNGSGKTTTIKMLSTLLTPSRGAIEIMGHSLSKEVLKIRRLIGYVPQSPGLDPDLTGYENLAFLAKLYGLETRKTQIFELFERAELTHFMNELTRNYSGGMRRQLDIAAALIHDPDILILDEPANGLDPHSRRAFWPQVHQWQMRKKNQRVIFFSSHDMNEVEQYCDLVAFMEKGKLVFAGTPQELKSQMGSKAKLEDAFTYYENE